MKSETPLCPPELLVQQPPIAIKFERLENLVVPLVGTEHAAFYLGLRPNTLRIWACYQTGPLQPLKIGRALRWRVADIRRLVGMAQT
jgi:hypothetical protein